MENSSRIIFAHLFEMPHTVASKFQNMLASNLQFSEYSMKKMLEKPHLLV